jgi:murein DD-endopeptidase MepM/ murein hydrolase activator NlpD
MTDLAPTTINTFPVRHRPGLLLATVNRPGSDSNCPMSISFHDGFNDRRPSGQTHHAVDIGGAMGLEILATVAGTVPASWSVYTRGRQEERAGIGNNTTDGGYYVMIRDADGYYHYYAHLWEQPQVGIGDTVHAGKLLGYLGMSGNTQYCPHLHYQVTQREGGLRYFNPYLALRRLALLRGGTASREPRGGVRIEVTPG